MYNFRTKFLTLISPIKIWYTLSPCRWFKY